MMRLDKYLAQQLGIPRSESRRMCGKGQVAVDGVLCRKADKQIDEVHARVCVNGKQLNAYQKYVYIMLNKPQGVVSASRDNRDTTVVNLVESAYPRRQLFPAGRLDKTSTGFVLLTDDGVLAHDILAPGRHVSKQYLVELDAPVTDEVCADFSAGVTLADGERMEPAEITAVSADKKTARVVLHQGVYHQIKRMLGVYDIGVNALHREAIGGVALDGSLAPGEYRELTEAELEQLRKA